MDSNKCGFWAAEMLNYFMKELEERLRNAFCHRWCIHLDTSERLSVYNNYKHCFKRERYEDVLWMEVYRHSLAQFRMDVSQINLHRHRLSPTTDHTTCPLFANKQETEKHFVFQCPLYDQLRSIPDGHNWCTRPQKTPHHPHQQKFSGHNFEYCQISSACI